MSVRLRLTLIVVLVALVPLGVSALLTFRIHQQAFDEVLGALHRKTAENAAARVHASLVDHQQGLERLTTKVVTWDELSRAERDAALWLVFREHPDILSASLLDLSGQQQARHAYLVPETAPSEPDHPVARFGMVRQLLAGLGQSEGDIVRVGDPVFHPDLEQAIVPVEVPVRGPEGRRWTVVVMVSLRSVCEGVRSGEAGGMELLLLDEGGRVLCGQPKHARGKQLAGLKLESGTYAPAHYLGADGQEMMQSSVQLPRGWWAVAQRPSADALAPSQRMRWLGAWSLVVSLLSALVIGLLLARSVIKPLTYLMQTATRFGQGQYDQRVQLAGGGELSALGDAFDSMRTEIRRRDAEIREFSDKLRERVEAQTAQLTQAHEQLLSSQKQAVLSTLSSGIAAEVNNPLTGVLGLAQLLRARAEGDPSRQQEGDLLRQIEQAAQRIRTVMMGLLALSEKQENNQFAPVSLNDLLASTARLVQAEADGKGVRLACEYSLQPLVVEGDFTQLQQAVLQLLTNAISATDADGQVHVRPQQSSGEVASIVIADNGSGIPAEVLDRIYDPFFSTKRAPEGAGLGLTVAHRIVELHRGTLHAESDLGVGTRVTITLPLIQSLEMSA